MIILKTSEEIEIMAAAGKKLAGVLETLKKEIKTGIGTDYLDKRALELIKAAGAEPAFLGYQPGGAKKPYPATLCVSVNETIVHGLPSSYVIKDGDLVKLDLGLKYYGFYVDAALTIGVGILDFSQKRIIAATERALYGGIAAALTGNTLGDIGWAIEKSVKGEGFSVAEKLTGHGIGRKLHEEPYVFNFGRPGRGDKLKEGMVLAVEPMVSAGSGKVKQLADDSFVTADNSLAAHFEHTVAITEKGPRILTK